MRIQFSQIVARYHCAHARQRPGFAGVDSHELRVWVGTAQCFGVNLPGKFQIGDIIHRATDFGASADHLDIDSDESHAAVSAPSLATAVIVLRASTRTRRRL